MSDLNDPRVFFAAERTLLAWNRTSIALMAFGFVIERFGLFIKLMMPERTAAHATEILVSFYVGISFVVLGAVVAVLSSLQYRRILTTLKPVEIPDGYRSNLGVVINLVVAVIGVGLVLALLAGPH